MTGPPEKAFLLELKALLPQDARVVLLADRGFGHADLLRFIRKQLGFEFCVRLPANKTVLLEGQPVHLGDLAVARGQVRSWEQAVLRAGGVALARLVLARPKEEGPEMDPWFLASSLPWSPQRLLRLYAKRMLLEEDIRSAKSLLY